MIHLKHARRFLAAGGVSAAALTLPVIALAQPRTQTTSTTERVSFSGRCSFPDASIDFSPGLKLAEANTTDTVGASGSCGSAGSGRLTGTVTDRANCTGGQGTATGTGTLLINRTSIPVKLAWKITLPNGKLTVSGTTSGSGTATTQFLTGSNIGSMPGCVGAGLRHVSFHATLTTSSPIVSTVRSAKSRHTRARR